MRLPARLVRAAWAKSTARDTKLRRDVAIKVLPEAFAADPERPTRFTREAHVLATLNHPNIASIYGIEDSGGVHALVLELVEGPTLADRITAGAMAASEALKIATEIADAIEAAHEKGLIHRDLKPANINLTADDRVKVLDFGLAKALSDDAGRGISASPTMTAMASRLGVIVGTAAYMSPEQAQGKTVDKRAPAAPRIIRRPSLARLAAAIGVGVLTGAIGVCGGRYSPRSLPAR